MDAHLLCPLCGAKGGVHLERRDGKTARADCVTCGRGLSVLDGIPDFAPHVPLLDPELRPIQKLNSARAFARLYETFVWRGFATLLGSGLSMKQEVREVLGASTCKDPKSILDLACGTGHYARALETAFPEAEVYALDVSMGMLVEGVKKAREAGQDSINFLRGDMYRLPFGDQTIDLVNCCGVLHLFCDLEPVWREIARVLRPGGAFTGWTLIALPRWGERKFQERLMNRGKATFFRPARLKEDFERNGLIDFRFIKRRAWLIFRATKRKGAEKSSLRVGEAAGHSSMV